MRLGVVADDLTGALDAGVQLRDWGLAVSFLTGAEGSAVGEADAFAASTDSRAAAPDEAFRRVGVAVKQLHALGVDRFFKKIDSTLRGNVGAELDAAMSASESGFCVFAPAYPTYGRTTLAGRQLVDNAPLDRTGYAAELPVQTSEVAEVIRHQCGRRAGLVSFDSIKAGAGEIGRRLSEMQGDGVEIAVCDALTERDLTEIARASADVRLVVGSSGLAAELPPALGLRAPRPVLSVCGSTRRESRVQVRALVDRMGFREIDINVGALIGGEEAARAEVERCVAEAREALSAGRDASITTSPRESSHEEFTAYANSRGISQEDARRFIEEAAGMITSAIVDGLPVGLVLVGGSTGLRVCQRLGAASLDISGELEPGVPVAILPGGTPVILKPGGFGSDDALIKAAQRLRRVL